MAQRIVGDRQSPTNNSSSGQHEATARALEKMMPGDRAAAMAAMEPTERSTQSRLVRLPSWEMQPDSGLVDTAMTLGQRFERRQADVPTADSSDDESSERNSMRVPVTHSPGVISCLCASQDD